MGRRPLRPDKLDKLLHGEGDQVHASPDLGEWYASEYEKSGGARSHTQNESGPSDDGELLSVLQTRSFVVSEAIMLDNSNSFQGCISSQ